MTTRNIILFILTVLILGFSYLKEPMVLKRGNIPVLITVPHGGSGRYMNIKKRNCSPCKTVSDSYTISLAKNISYYLDKEFNSRPSVLYMNIHRSRIDVNRNTDEGCNDYSCIKYYNEYHNYIKKELSRIIKKYGYAILIDLHGQSSSKEMQIGYNVPHRILRGNIFSANKYKNTTFKNSVLRKYYTNTSLLFGKNSFISTMSNNDINIYPTPSNRKKKIKYLDGGYTVEKYSNINSVYAVQIEVDKNSRFSRKRRIILSKKLSRSINRFNKYYNEIYNKHKNDK